MANWHDQFFKLAFCDEEDLQTALEPIVNRDATTDFLIGLLRYVVQTSPPSAESDILKTITRPQNRELVMTLVDKWKADATLAERREVLVRLLERKFGLGEKDRHIVESCGDLDRLAAALDTFVDAGSKDEVLAELR